MLKKIYTLLILGLFGLTSCVQDETPNNINPGPRAEDGYLQIHMNLPELKSQQAGEPSTKAMNDEAERMIKLDQLNVLVFKEDAGTEKYAYKAPLSGAVEYDSEDGTKARITVKLARSTGSEKYRLVLVANHDLSGVTLSANETKAIVLEKLTYNIAGKWNANASNYTPFPMWGESDLVTINTEMSGPSINMYRALARIDVGFNFTTEGTTLNESAEGDINHFNIKEVKVYRTYNQGYATPTNSDITTAPFIPSTATRRADTAPLEYSVTGGTNSYVREIYIPEANLPVTPANDNMHCIVVGGSYKGSSATTYYRLDFATETNPEGERTYLPVLRNHRYVFNITQVRGPGFTTPQAALESTATIENINYDLIKWDETIHKMEVQGKYYFGLDQRNMLFSPQSNVTRPIRYQTNMPEDSVRFEFKKGSSSPFSTILHSHALKRVMVYPKQENITNELLTDTLFVKAGSFSIPVYIQQQYVNFKYTINCETVNVFGTYKNGTTLNNTNYIDFSFTAEDRTSQGRTYEFHTSDLEGNHGISFSATGTFDFTGIPEGLPLTINIRMYGSGTLNHSEEEGPFKLRIKSNSSSGSYCEATINPVKRKMKILVLGNQVMHGYNIALENTGSYKLLTSTNNFGPYDHSIVKTEGFELINAHLDTGSPNINPGLAQVKSWLIDGPDIVDILYITQDAYVYSASSTYPLANYIAQYLDNDGVVLVFSEGNVTSAANIMNACFNVTNITQILQTPAGLIYQLAGDPMQENDPYFADPVLNGPFGDVRKKHWGEDASFAAILSNVPTDKIIIYSNGMPINGTGFPSDRVNMISGFRHKTKNLLYFGDGGFTSSGTNGQPYLLNSSTLCPLNWNTSTMFPIPYPSYGAYSAQMEVYNSQVWCNAMAWAIDRAVNHGINTK